MHDEWHWKELPSHKLRRKVSVNIYQAIRIGSSPRLLDKTIFLAKIGVTSSSFAGMTFLAF